MKRKGILEFMKNCLSDSKFNPEVSSNKNVVRLIKILLSDLCKHYGFIDIEKYSNHQQRFFLLYIDKNNLTFKEISEATYVSMDVFKDYVKSYNNMVLKFITEQSKKCQSYAFLLKMYQDA